MARRTNMHPFINVKDIEKKRKAQLAKPAKYGKKASNLGGSRYKRAYKKK